MNPLQAITGCVRLLVISVFERGGRIPTCQWKTSNGDISWFGVKANTVRSASERLSSVHYEDAAQEAERDQAAEEDAVVVIRSRFGGGVYLAQIVVAALRLAVRIDAAVDFAQTVLVVVDEHGQQRRLDKGQTKISLSFRRWICSNGRWTLPSKTNSMDDCLILDVLLIDLMII